MRPITKTLLRYGTAALIVLVASVIADTFSRVTGTSRLTSIFLSSVLLAAFYLGRGPGYLAAVLAMVSHLYLVDPPYEFSLGSIDELNALTLFAAASILTCLLAGRVREEAAAAKARARAAASLLEATRELSATADEEFIRERLAHRLQLIGGGDALVREGLRLNTAVRQTLDPQDVRLSAGAERAARDGPPETRSQDGWSFRGLVAGEQAFGIAGWRPPGGRLLGRDEQAALELLADTGAAAIARARLAAAKADAETRARTEDLRNALLASISHDLRTPLSVIMGSASSLRRFADEFDAPTRRDLAATIEEEAARLDAFVSNLLQMTRLQSGGVPLKRIAFGLEETIRGVVERRDKGEPRRISVAVEAKLPDALGDPTLFEQALGNVLENALRYAAGDGPIAVAARRSGDALVVEVADHGPGVPGADLERIFDKFFRSTSAGRIGGTGLGLSISRGLIGAMGGRVVAEARGDGSPGLVVQMTMPTAGP